VLLGEVRGKDKNMKGEKCERNDKEIEEEIKEGNKKHENILKNLRRRTRTYQYRKRYEYL
jgi:hypothetical protein